jgi:ABC-type xylose transport system permease subunit
VGINLIVLAGLPILLARNLRPLKESFPLVPFFAAISFFPAFISLLQGQDSILLLLLFTLVFVAIKQKNDLLAGSLLALGLFKFHITAPLLCVLMLRRRWRILSGFLVVSFALALVSLQVTGWKGLIAYPGFLWQLNQGLVFETAQQQHAIYPASMPNLRGFLFVFLGRWIPSSMLTLLIFVVSIALLLWTSSRWRRKREGGELEVDLAFSLSVTTALLVSYHLHLHDLSLLVLPILLTLNYWVAVGSQGEGPRAWPVKLVMLLFLTPLYLLLLQLDQLYLLFWLVLALAFILAAEITSLRKKGLAS